VIKLKVEFKKEILIDREKEIATYLLQNLSLTLMSEKTGLSKKLLTAHIRNMMEKLKAKDTAGLLKLLRAMEL
jgi:DNA-binding CsgD family transcriptional regulator